MFNAAGLMVPDPSIMLPPIPFIEDDAGSGAEYMVASLAWGCWSPLLSHRPSRCARAPVRGMAARLSDSTVLVIVDDEVWRGFVACREWSRAKKSLGPLFPGTMSTLPFQPAKVEWRRTGR